MSASQDPINLFPLERAYQRNSIVFNQREYSVMDVPDVHPGADFDSAPGIQRLIDLVTDDGGGVIFFPTGIYRIDAGLTVGSNVTLAAHSPLTSVLEIGVDGLTAITCKSGANDWSVIGLGLQVGVGVSGVGATAVLADACSGVFIADCIASPGILLRPGAAINTFDVGFDVADSNGSKVRDCKGTSSVFTYRIIANAAAGTFSGNTIERCSTYSEAELAGSGSGGIDFAIDGSGGAALNGSLFFQCTSENAGSSAFVQTGSAVVGTSWLSCTARSPTGRGWQLTGTNTDTNANLRDCLADSAGSRGYTVSPGTTGVSFVACAAQAGSSNGFEVINTSGVQFASCVSTGNAANGYFFDTGFFTSASDISLVACQSIGDGGIGFQVQSSGTGTSFHFVDCVSRSSGSYGYLVSGTHGGAVMEEINFASCLTDQAGVDGFAMGITPGVGLRRGNLSGCTATNSTGHGFALFDGADVNISACLASDSGLSGFEIDACNGMNISSCLAFSNTTSGFVVSNGSEIDMSGNKSDSNTLQGFDISGVTDLRLGDNQAVANLGGDGFSVATVTSSAIAANVADGNSADGFHINAGSDHHFTDNLAKGHLAGKGIHIQAATDVHANGNTSRDNSDDGFHIDNCTRSDLSGNRANDNGSEGFHIDDSTTVHMTGNYAYNNTADGITVDGTSGDIHLDSNHSHDNTGDGIHVDTITNCQLSGNQTRDNGGDGIHMDACVDWQLHNHRSESNTGTGILLTSNGGDYHVSHCVSTGHGTPIASGGNMFETGGTTTARIIDNDIELTIPPTLAFTAALTIPNFPDIFRLTGTATTTSMIGSYVGRRVFLLNASGTQTLANTATLDLDAIAGSPYVMNVAKERIEIYYDGVAWIEESRSGP